MRQFYVLLISHFKEIAREPSVLFWGIVFPILMAWGLGMAFTSKQELVGNIVYIEKNVNAPLPSFLSSRLDLKKLTENGKTFYQYNYSDKKTGKVKFNFYPKKWEDANTMLKRGETSVVVVNKNGQPVYFFDKMNQEAQLLYLQLTGLLEKGPSYFSEQVEHAQPLIIAGTRYVDFLIPGLMGMGIMMSCMWGISYSLIEKRSKKLLRRMVATPMQKPLFLASVFTARFVMNIVEASILFIFAYFYFGMRVQGNAGALIMLLIAGNIAFSGIAALISSRTANSEVGNGLINAVVTPMMVVSGVFFSYHTFPDWLITVIRPLPLTMLNDSVRAVFNEGAGFAESIRPTLVLMLEGSVMFVLALKLFKWY
jgi:ABC-2 type transport system permease protein